MGLAGGGDGSNDLGGELSSSCAGCGGGNVLGSLTGGVAGLAGGVMMPAGGYGRT